MGKTSFPYSPKISVIIPTYNYAEKLATAVESVLKQSYRNLEVIVVDDKSDDNTENIMGKFIDKRILYIRNYDHLGVYKSVNIGIKKAKGKYFCQLDADDKLYSNSLQLRYNYLMNHSLEAVHTGISIVDKGHRSYVPPLNTRNRKNIISFLNGKNFGYGINICTFLFSKKVIEKIGYRDESNEFFPHNDYEYVLRMLLECHVGIINRSTYIYQKHSKSHSDIHGKSQNSEDRLRKLKEKYIIKFSH